MPSTTPEDSQGIEAIQFEKQDFPLGVAAPGCVRLARMGSIYDDEWLEYTDSATNQKVLVAQPRVRAGRTASVNVSPNTPTIIDLTSERWDTDTMHDPATNPSRVTCKRHGIYLLVAQVAWESSSTFERVVEIVLNGSTVIALSRKRAAGNAAVCLQTFYELHPGDYVEVRVAHNGDGNLEVEAHPYSPEFTVTRIG